MHLDRAVALAGGLTQPFQIVDLDVAAAVADQAGLLQRIGDQRYAGPPHAEHLAEELLRQRQTSVAGKIVVPGLIDLHTHVYWGGTSLGVEAELLARSSDYTTPPWGDAYC